MKNSLLSIAQEKNFLKRKYSKNDIDYADYNCISSKYQNLDIITCGWMIPHEDTPWGADDTWTMKVLSVNDPLDETVCFLHTLSDGKIVGHYVEVDKFYTFIFSKTHALLPCNIAFEILKEQNFKIKVVDDFIINRNSKDYFESSKMAFCFLNIESSNIFL